MSLGIAGRLAVVLAAFAILASSVTGWAVYRSSRDLLIDAAQSRLHTTTQVLGRRIVGVVEAAANDARRMADNSEVRTILRHPGSPSARANIDDLAEQFAGQLRVSPEYYQIRLISAADNGMERLRLERDAGGEVHRVAEGDLQEKGHFAYVFDTLKLPPGAIYASPMSINHEVGGAAGNEVPTTRIAVPVRDDAGEPYGLVVFSLSLEGIFSVLGEDLPKDHELYLTDRQGEFLMHPDSHQAFAFDRGQSSRVQTQFPETASLFDGTRRSLITTRAERDGETRPVAAAFVRVHSELLGEERFMVIGLAQPLAEVLGDTRRLALTALAIIAGFATLALALAAWLGSALTLPLRRMAECVRNFPAAHDTRSLPVTRNDEIGALAQGLAVMQDDIAHKMKELEQQRVEMAHQARHDPLTGLPNRLLYADRIEQALARAVRSGEPMALLFIDLDKFKAINDQHGHAAGDAMLVAAAQRMRATIRAADTVARIGGDEFVVLLEGTDDIEFLRTIADKLIEALSVPLVWQGSALVVGASIGVACFPRDGDGIDALSTRADAAMYRAKLRGGNQVTVVSVAPG